MRIAILGAGSQIAGDWIRTTAARVDRSLHLFARNPDSARVALGQVAGLDRHSFADFHAFRSIPEIDVIINFVGSGDPGRTASIGSAIFDITLEFDQMAIDYLRIHPDCRYVFLSSGAVYGGDFEHPVNTSTLATTPINQLASQDWYGAAKLHAECRHRALADHAIVDLRLFNYVSRYQNISSRYLFTDIARALCTQTCLEVSANNIVRDFLHPTDFAALLECVLAAPPVNQAIDAFTKSPTDKISLLDHLNQQFGLNYNTVSGSIVNATGQKTHYYSRNRRAELLGYRPTRSALEAVTEELRAIIDRHGATFS